MLKTFVAALFTGLVVLTAPRAKAQELPAQLQGLTEDQVNQTLTFVRGAIHFVMFHEAGHMLVSELDLPVLAREEDAVDTLSALVLLNTSDSDLDGSLYAASAAWMMLGEQSSAQGVVPPLWDEHSLDQQRGYNIICLMYGSDPVKFAEAADAVSLPDSRRHRCGREYSKALSSWESVLAPHASQQPNYLPFDTRYIPPDNQALEYWASFAVAEGFLEPVRRYMKSSLNLKDDIRFTARECGVENAFWSPDQRELTLCFELMPWFANVFVKQTFRQ